MDDNGTMHSSGTVFFSNCNLRCVYCQNYEISDKGYGKCISILRLKNIFIEQQERGAKNINLVSPTIYADKIKKAVVLAKKEGLKISIIYNTNGYEKVETLKTLEGIIDIYLPDFKYGINEIGKKYSKVDNYFDVVVKALKEMKRQCPNDIFDDSGAIITGVIIRHMILPGYVFNTKKVLETIKENFGTEQYISIMAQYFPANKVNDREYPEINRKITKEELKEVQEYIDYLGFENGYIQELGEHEEEYVPKFDLKNV